VKAHDAMPRTKHVGDYRQIRILAAIVTDALVTSSFESRKEMQPDGLWEEAPVKLVLVSKSQKCFYSSSHQ